jgi:hypothetical protein
MKALFAATAAVAIAASSPALSAEMITNGGFENGSFAGWTLSNVGGGTAPVVIAVNQAGQYPVGAFGEAIPTAPNGGNYVAYFSSDTANPDTLSQMVNVVAGTTYNLSFDYYVPQNGYNNPNDATLGFKIGNVLSNTLQAGSPSGTPVKTWLHFTTDYTATTTGAVNMAFQFRGLGSTAADFAVDNVSMKAVPEPATWAMMILGLGIVGTSLRRRTTANVSFA